MTFEGILSGLTMKKIKPQEAYELISDKEKLKTINFYANFHNFSQNSLNDSQLAELEAIVNILQILYTDEVGSPISDTVYDVLQEELIYMGIPRLTGSIEINDAKKVSHQFTNLRGTLDKVYYLFPDQQRTNKSRKYLDEWIKSTETKYEKVTGKKINLNDVKVMCQCKLDGASCELNFNGDKALWLTRGDTVNNMASDVSHIMKGFNDVFCNDGPCGIKFEVMISEEDKDKINELYVDHPYKNSRQIVTATLNSKEPDFKVDYLYPVPLRIMRENDVTEDIHPMHIEKYPTLICELGDRDKIKEFANSHRYMEYLGKHYRTDGVVLTILDKNIQSILGRDNNINNFEVAYKFTEEYAYTKVKDCEFYVSEMSHITPVLVVNDVILKGNTINHISLSNKERFDEMGLQYGDTVKVLYDIIPYVTLDENCTKMKNGRKIEFITHCPMCKEELDLSTTIVKCNNPECESHKIGIILNYCNGVRIQNIGYNTLQVLYDVGLLKHGIRSLYKLKKKTDKIIDLDGFGKLKTQKIIAEIESKRKINDYEFFGSISIEGWNKKSFKLLFKEIPLNEFLDLIKCKQLSILKEKVMKISGIGDIKAEILIKYFSNSNNRKELEKILEEIYLISTYTTITGNGRICFSGCRPDPILAKQLESLGFDVSDSWSNSSKYLIIPNEDFISSKVNKANEKSIPILTLNELINKLSKGEFK